MKKKNKEEVMDVEFYCPMCGKIHYLRNVPVSLVDRVENRRENGEFIQDILKDYNKFDREKFMTGYCDECQEMLFGCKSED